MIKEILDKNSGAILFKKDADSLRYEEVIKKLESYEKELTQLKKKISQLEKSLIKSSK